MSPPQTPRFTFVDLCCGIGAFHISLQRLGGKCVLACDRDDRSKQVYQDNHGTDFEWHSDIFRLKDLPQHDVFCAGFPCTTFSTAGKRLGTLDNDAGQVIFAITRLLRNAAAKQQAPRVVLLENVPGLLSIHGGKTMVYIKRELAKLGYAVDARVFDAASYGAPMHRQRLIIAATRPPVRLEGTPGPKPSKRVAVVHDFLEPEERQVQSRSMKDDRFVLLPKASWYDHIGKRFVGYLTKVKYASDDLTKLSAHSQALKIFSTSGLSENFTSYNKYAFLVPHERDGDEGVVRYLTAREMYNCMGFPKRFRLYRDPAGGANSRSSGEIGVQIRQLTNSINLHMLKPVCKWVIDAAFPV